MSRAISWQAKTSDTLCVGISRRHVGLLGGSKTSDFWCVGIQGHVELLGSPEPSDIPCLRLSRSPNETGNSKSRHKNSFHNSTVPYKRLTWLRYSRTIPARPNYYRTISPRHHHIQHDGFGLLVYAAGSCRRDCRGMRLRCHRLSWIAVWNENYVEKERDVRC